jgi:integrase
MQTRVTVGGEHWEPKTEKNRPVPVNKALGKYLDTYKPASAKGKWFFSSPEGSRWDPDNFSEWLREENEKAGLVWTCLDYGHTSGGHLAMKGVSLYEISELSGTPDTLRIVSRKAWGQ